MNANESPRKRRDLPSSLCQTGLAGPISACFTVCSPHLIIRPACALEAQKHPSRSWTSAYRDLFAAAHGQRISDVSNAEINRELATLKRIFNLAIEQDRIAIRPTIKLLQESAARSGFFEREQYESVLAHLPSEIQPVITFAYITGWRIASEVLPLEWRNVDFAAGEVRLDAGATRNGAGRVFPMTTNLRLLLQAQHAEHERLKKAGHIFPNVFYREVADERGGAKHPTAITSFTKSWRIACRAAGCPGRIPHDLRRTAVRNLVRAGIPERVAMMMTGHKTPSVFARYDIVSDGDLREAAHKLNVAGGFRR
jgi:integrase